MTRLLFLSSILWLFWGCSNDDNYVEAPTEDQTEDIFNPKDIEYDSIVDVRDSQTYKITKINGKWWMAENLNYAVDSSFCYNDEPDSCAIYGRLYPWTVAMNIDTMYGKYNATFDEKIKSKHQGLCPKGWHIPTEKEWEEMLDYADSHNGDEGVGASMRTKYGWLRQTASEWVNHSFVDRPAAYTNRFGFSCLPGGYRKEDDGAYDHIGIHAHFWSSTEYTEYRNESIHAKYITNNGLMNVNGMHALNDGNKYSALSVRCKKN